MKRKIIAAMVFVLVCAGSAMAAPCGPAGGPAMRGACMTPEMKVKADEMFRLCGELKAELQKESPDKNAARGIHDKIAEIRTELDRARFEEALKNPKTLQRPARQGRGPVRPELTEAQKAKHDELRTLHRNIRAELNKEMPNKALIRDWAKQAQKIKNDLEDMKLEDMLKDPAKYKNTPMFGAGARPGPRGHRGGACNCWAPAQ